MMRLATALVVLSAGLVAHPADTGARTGSDLCDAARHQGFVGRPVGQLQRVRPPGRTARYVCRPGCAMTMDYSPVRMTVSYDSPTGSILDVRCG